MQEVADFTSYKSKPFLIGTRISISQMSPVAVFEVIRELQMGVFKVAMEDERAD